MKEEILSTNKLMTDIFSDQLKNIEVKEVEEIIVRTKDKTISIKKEMPNVSLNEKEKEFVTLFFEKASWLVINQFMSMCHTLQTVWNINSTNNKKT